MRQSISAMVFGLKRQIENVIFIDPGVSGTGYAIWEELQHDCGSIPNQLAVIPRLSTGKTWLQRAAYIAAFFRTLISTRGEFDFLVIEFPTLWVGSSISQAAAAKGNLHKLAYCVGSIARVFYENHSGILPILVEPAQWKGQMSKQAVKARIKRAIGVDVKSHAADAVGMGLAAAGVL